MAVKYYFGAVLVFVILTSSIYFMIPDKVRIDIENTRTKYFVYEDKFVLAATEYLNLYDGTTKMRAKSRDVSWFNDSQFVYAARISKWKDNITTIQTYKFEQDVDDVRNFPLENKLECYNCEGKIVHYEIRDILYDGETQIISSPFSFGHNMKVEWQTGAYYSKVFQQKSSDKIIIKYRPIDSYEEYLVRLFDPPNQEEFIYDYDRNLVNAYEPYLLERTVNTETIKNPDGTFKHIIYLGPKFIDDKTGIDKHFVLWNFSFMPIINSSYKDYEYQLDDYYSNYQAYFQDDIKAGKGFRFEIDGYWFTYDLSGGKMQWAVENKTNQDWGKTKAIGSVLTSNPTNNSNKIIYENAFTLTDVEYEMRLDGVKENFILNSMPSTPEDFLYLEYTGELEFDGNLTIWANGENQTSKEFTTFGSIGFKDSGNSTVYSMPSPTAIDSDGNSIGLIYDVKPNGEKLFFGLKIPVDFLLTAAYPINIDPSINILATTTTGKVVDEFGTGTWRWLENNLASTGQSDGDDGQRFRGFSMFDTSSIPDAGVIDDVDIRLYTTSDSVDWADCSGTLFVKFYQMDFDDYDYTPDTDGEIQSLFAGIDDSFLANGQNVYGTTGVFFTTDLGTTADSKLESLLASDEKYVVGFLGNADHPSNVIDCKNDIEGDTAEANRPRLTVVYTLNTCTYTGSGNWNIDCSDNCLIDEAVNIDGNLTLTGSGEVRLSSTLNFNSTGQRIVQGTGCKFIINSGGKIS